MSVRDIEEKALDEMLERTRAHDEPWLREMRSDYNRTVDTHVVWAVKSALQTIHKGRYQEQPHILQLIDEARAALEKLSRAIWDDRRRRITQWKERHGQ